MHDSGAGSSSSAAAAAAAAETGLLASVELCLYCLCTCLYPHLDEASRKALRPVCKVARDVIDARVQKLSFDGEKVGYRSSFQPLDTCGLRWPGAKHVCVQRYPRLGSLAGLPSKLESLTLTSSIRKASMAALAPLGSLAPTLTRLEVTGMQPDVASAEALAAVLRQLSALQQLSLGIGGIQNDALRALTSGLSHLKQLRDLHFDTFYRNERCVVHHSADTLAAALESLTGLESLRLQANVGLSRYEGGLATVLSKLSHLTLLDLGGCHLGHSNYVSENNSGRYSEPSAFGGLARPLGQLSSLHTLRLSHSNVGCALSALPPTQLPGLRVLQLVCCQLHRAGKALASALGCVPFLTHLDLDHNYLSHEDILSFGPALGRLVHLHELDACRAVDVRYYAANLLPWVSRLPRLTVLRVSDGYRERPLPVQLPSAVSALSRFAQLEVLELAEMNFDDTCAEALVEVLQHCTGLRFLNLKGNTLGGKSIAQLSPALAQLHHLQHLSLATHSWGLPGPLQLQLPPNLTSLDVSVQRHLPLQGRDAPAPALDATDGLWNVLVPVLRCSPRLQRLTISMTQLGRRWIRNCWDDAAELEYNKIVALLAQELPQVAVDCA